MIKNLLTIRIKPKFLLTKRANSKPGLILDVGMANDSYAECRAVFPDAIYHGIDLFEYGSPSRPDDKFFVADLNNIDNLKKLDEKYDLIIVNHVLEHIRVPNDLFRALLNYLTPNGLLYVEFPSIRSAYGRSTYYRYHFHDDTTHCSFCSVEAMANIAVSQGFKIISCGPISTLLKDVLSIPRAIIGMLRFRPFGAFLVHLQRKIDHVFVLRPTQHRID